MSIKVTAIILKPDNWLAKIRWKLLKIRVVTERRDTLTNFSGETANCIIVDEIVEPKTKLVMCSTPKGNSSFFKLLEPKIKGRTK